MHSDARTLRPGEAEPEATGDCYEAALNYLMEIALSDKTARLVHGVCLIQSGPYKDLPFGHAWVEVRETLPSPPEWDGPPLSMTFCIDKSNGKDIKMPQALYYILGRVGQTKVYTPIEAAHKAVVTGHWGHWDLDVER